MDQVNWGIIGLGAVALQFAKSFKFTNNAKLLGIASKNFDRLNKFKEEFSIANDYCFNNYQSLLENDEIDIIYIALPTSLHKEWIIKCLSNKKRILVEKPATINSSEIIDIKKNYFNKNFFFTEAFMYLYHPQVKKILEIINSGEIGKLISMESSFGQDILTKKNIFGFKKRKKLNPENRLYNKKLGGGAILDLGCYPVSFSTLIASLVSNIDYDKIEISNKIKEIGSTGVDLDSYMKLKFENGFTSFVSASFTKNLGKKTKILGSKGELIIEDTWTAQPAKIFLKKKNEENIVININSNENIYVYEIENVSKHVLDNNTEVDFPGLKIDDIVGNMKIIDKWLD
jgi:predicted dehydrogenase